MAFFNISALRTLLATETDENSEANQLLFDTIRQNAEAFLMLMLSTGVSGSADSNPPNNTTGVLADAAPGFSTDAHNGRTLLITSGLAIGNLYTIDDTTAATIVCTGDNLYADGVRAGDTYLILYDLKNSTAGHDHDGVNSHNVVLANYSIYPYKLETGSLYLPLHHDHVRDTPIDTNFGATWTLIAGARINVPEHANVIRMAIIGNTPVVAAVDVKIVLGATESSPLTVSDTWQTLDILANTEAGPRTIELWARYGSTGTKINGFSFFWT